MEDRNAPGSARQATAGAAPDERPGSGQAPHGASSPFLAPGPDVMLGMWSSWMETASSAVQSATHQAAQHATQALAGGAANPFGAFWGDIGGDKARSMWQVAPDEAVGRLLASGVGQFNDALKQDPVLRSIDTMWNANPLRDIVPVDWAEVARALRTVWLRSLRDPTRVLSQAAELNANFLRAAADAWNDACRRWLSGTGADGTEATNKGGDKRFAAPEWHTNPVYRTLKDMYLLASDWLLRQGEAADLGEAERHRLDFHLRQFVDAMSPTLMLLSNPAALRRAMETGGASLADGARNLLDDLRQGRLSMVDATAFAPGRNLALSPGKVVYRNALIELIQYAPTTETVHATPLLIIPPWINKFYILDLQPKNSMVRHLVGQGFTVFMISWRNPDASMDGTTIEDYVDLGPLAASDAIREITGSPRLNVMGYCIGGTLLAMTLAWLAKKGDDRFGAATFIVSLQDFAKVGDTAIFVDEPAISLVEQQMMERGYLDSREMSNMFNLLRANDLIWSNVVNNYLMGEKPAAFDLLYWNSDGTRMTRAAHSWYLRNTYLENNLIQPGRVELKGEALDLGRIALDIYAVGAEKDHIVPWDAAWRITQLTGGKVRYVLASSGHIAGIINPPGGKGIFWTNDADPPPATPEEWRQSAQKHDGSWWTDWVQWLARHSGRKGKLPSMGSAAHPPQEDAPGKYVLEK